MLGLRRLFSLHILNSRLLWDFSILKMQYTFCRGGKRGHFCCFFYVLCKWFLVSWKSFFPRLFFPSKLPRTHDAHDIYFDKNRLFIWFMKWIRHFLTRQNFWCPTRKCCITSEKSDTHWGRILPVVAFKRLWFDGFF